MLGCDYLKPFTRSFALIDDVTCNEIREHSVLTDSVIALGPHLGIGSGKVREAHAAFLGPRFGVVSLQ